MPLPKGENPKKKTIYSQAKRITLTFRIKKSLVCSLSHTRYRSVGGKSVYHFICFNKDYHDEVVSPGSSLVGVSDRDRKMYVIGSPKSSLLCKVPLSIQNSWEGKFAKSPIQWLQWPLANKSITSFVPYLTFGYDEYLECVFCGLKPEVKPQPRDFKPQEKN